MDGLSTQFLSSSDSSFPPPTRLIILSTGDIIVRVPTIILTTIIISIIHSAHPNRWRQLCSYMSWHATFITADTLSKLQSCLWKNMQTSSGSSFSALFSMQFLQLPCNLEHFITELRWAFCLHDGLVLHLHPAYMAYHKQKFNILIFFHHIIITLNAACHGVHSMAKWHNKTFQSINFTIAQSTMNPTCTTTNKKILQFLCPSI